MAVFGVKMSSCRLAATLQVLLLVGSLGLCLHAQEDERVDGNYDELPIELRKEVIKLQGSFREIQEAIGQEKNANNPGASIEVAKALQKNWVSGLLNNKLNEALRIFTALPSVGDSPACSYGDYEILAKNFLLNPNSGQFVTATTILYHYARQHAAACLPHYESRLTWIVKGVDVAQMRMRLYTLLSGLVIGDFSRYANKLPSEVQDSPLAFVEANLDSFDIRASGLTSILDNFETQFAPWTAPTADKLNMIEEKLLKKCSAFVDATREIYAPAKIDLFMSQVGSQVSLPQYSGAFLNSWKFYRVCLYFNRAGRKEILSRFKKALQDV